MNKRTYVAIIFLLSFVFCLISILAILVTLQLLSPTDSEFFRLTAFTTLPISLLFAAAWTYLMNKGPRQAPLPNKKKGRN